MKGSGWILYFAVLLFVGGVTGCSDDDDYVVLSPDPDPPPGEVLDGNLCALHEQSGNLHETLCITCHGDMTDDTTLDPDVKGIHTLHDEEINYACTTCHESTDLVTESGANIRKQVSPKAICDKCHGPGGVGKQLYLK